MVDASIARNRFGLGTGSDETLPTDPRRWLIQFASYRPTLPAAPTSTAIAARLRGYCDKQQASRQHDSSRRQSRQQQQQQQQQEPAPAMADALCYHP